MKKTNIFTFFILSFFTAPLFGVEFEGFECAEKSRGFHLMLGRGQAFPEFLGVDIETELKRQHKASKLVRLTCNSKPEINLEFAEKNIAGKTEQVVAELSVKFNVTAIVNTGKKNQTLQLSHGYLAKNLNSPGEEKLTQHFEVLK